ncbi:MAG: phenylalanine--tRNA ligase subunit beta [Terriglobales bacterium]
MRVLLSWLREMVPIGMQARELAQALTLAGQAVDTVTELAGGDALLELDLSSNRPDCLSHAGLAREIGALSGQALRAPERAELPRFAAGKRVQIEAPEGCGLYCALQFENVRVGATPEVQRQRLEALGHRSINNVADATNYTLWEMGHPTHAFDSDKLRGGQIHVRWAQAGEKLVTLDEVERTLAPEDLVIADGERPVALAGILGGLETAITPGTRRVLLESAWFDPLTVRRAARRHGLHTEASHRFERGADPGAAVTAAQRIATLLHGVARPAVGGLIFSEGKLPQRMGIRLRQERILKILGAPIEAAACQRMLEALGCEQREGAWWPPTWRPDLTREIDLIEELARLYGYDHFPSRLPPLAGMGQPLPEARLRDRVRQQLRGRGFAEAMALSFAAETECRDFAPPCTPVRVVNPLSEEAAILRTTSAPSMLHLLRYNAHRGVGARLFENGKIYQLENGKPRERRVLTLGACDAKLTFSQWKGEVAAVLALFDITVPEAEGTAEEHLDPGARLGPWAWLGRLHPAVSERWKLPPHTWLAEIALERCFAAGPRPVAYQPPPRFPASERDFSFLFDDSVTWAQARRELSDPAIPNLVALEPAEVFRNARLGEGRYSLLVRARFQSAGRTLREEEVQAASEEIIARLKGLGGTQR